MALADEFGLSLPKPRMRTDTPSLRETTGSALLALFSFGLGILYFVGGNSRFQGLAFSVARSWAPWFVWASILTAYGVALFLTRNKVFHWAILGIGTFFYVIFAVGGIVSIFPAQPTRIHPSFTIPWLFVWMAIAHLVTALARVHSMTERSSPL